MEAYVDFVGRQWLGFGDVNLGDVGPALGRDERFGGVLERVTQTGRCPMWVV